MRPSSGPLRNWLGFNCRIWKKKTKQKGDQLKVELVSLINCSFVIVKA